MPFPSGSRRRFLQALGAASGLVLLDRRTRAGQGANSRGRVVVVGGGFGGATAAKYIRAFDPWIEVILVERKEVYFTCPASNWVLGGLRGLASLKQDYAGLLRRGIRIVRDEVVQIEPDERQVRLKGGAILTYDRLIVSPGIDFLWHSIEGYGPQAAERLPHAWEAGRQTQILLNQLRAMRDGGTVIITSPPNYYRCPPGPYERASMIAHYLKTHKPRSKVIILDSKSTFSKQELFAAGWRKLYGFESDDAMIEWVPGPDGEVHAVDVDRKIAIAGPLEDKFRADVLNVIPAQRAAGIAQIAGLANETGWCPVDFQTWESALQKGVHVIGDSAIQDPMPKSAYAANSQAKVCADAVVALLNERGPGEPSWLNTCYSLVAPEFGISIADVYALGRGGVIAQVPGAGGTSAIEGDHKREAVYTRSWYRNIVNDTFG